MNGKGDTYRPTDKERFDKNYERVFGEEKDNYITFNGLVLNKKTGEWQPQKNLDHLHPE